LNTVRGNNFSKTYGIHSVDQFVDKFSKNVLSELLKEVVNEEVMIQAAYLIEGVLMK
jgi:hypothetical protein